MPVVYLIPTVLSEEALDTIPAYIKDAVADCSVFFAENERTARRYFKQLWKEMVIDDYEWHAIHKAEEETLQAFRVALTTGKNIGIVSEAGCPGVADPGQLLVAVAHEMGVQVKPLTGPSSIMLALMASGMNGQQFRFNGYLPIDNQDRVRALLDLESGSAKRNTTEIFIETPYRNNQLIESILKNCKPETRLCIAVDLTGKNEWIRTLSVKQWQKQKTDIHKRPAIFLLYSGEG